MSRLLKTSTLWLWGGFLYNCIELVWRGHSHLAMFIVGGLCFVLIGGLNNCFSWDLGLIWQALMGAVTVLAVELIAGCILNLWLGLGIWDYSDMPGNVLGQICLPYAFAWIGLSVVGIYLDDYLRWKLYGEQRPRYTLV